MIFFRGISGGILVIIPEGVSERDIGRLSGRNFVSIFEGCLIISRGILGRFLKISLEDFPDEL